MARKPAPTYTPVDQTPAQSSAERWCADGVLPIPEAAEFAGIYQTLLRNLLGRQVIASFKLGKRRVVPRRALVLYLAGQLRAAAQPQ